MFSKFSVLPKFYKHLRFQDNGLLRMFSYIAPSQGCTMKIVQIECGSNSIFMRRVPTKYICEPSVMLCKDGRPVQWTRKMSSNEWKGDGENPQKSEKDDLKLIKKSKGNWLRRKHKGRSSKKAEISKKRRKYLTQKNIIFEEIKPEVPKIPVEESSVKKEIFSLKPETFKKINKSKDISQSQLPPKKVHIEFMESHNLKDFKLSKIPSLQQSPNQSKGEIKKILNGNESNQEKDIKLILFVSETQQLTKSSQDPKNQISKSVKTKIFKNKDLRKTKKVESQNKENKKEDPIIKKLVTNHDMDKSENKSETLSSYSEPLKRPIKSIIIKDTLQKNRDAMKEERSWEQNDNDISIKVSPKKYQNRLSKFNRSKMLEKATKRILGTIETLKNPPQSQELPLPKLVDNTQNPIVEMTNINTNSTTGETKNRTTVLFQTPNTFSKITSAGSIDAATKTDGSPTGHDTSTVQPPKTASTISPNGGPQPTHIPKNMFGDVIPPEKLKTIEPKITHTNALPKSGTIDPKITLSEALSTTGRPSPKKRMSGSTTKKTNKLNKFKRFGLRRRGGGGTGGAGGASGGVGGGVGGAGGESGDNTFVHNIPITPPKETPSSFWRNVSISMVPVVFAFTAYVFHNIGAWEMIKDFVSSTPDMGQTTLNVVPAFYSKDSENDDMEDHMQRDNENDFNSNDYDNDEEQENPSSSNTINSESFEESYLDDPRF